MNCPNCQTPNPDTARFCFNCGSPLQQPRQVEGERRIVTVMFADVVGSTPMAEVLDPEQVTEIMNGAFAYMNSTIAGFGGTVSRLMGDAVLAFFGAPVTHEHDPERAVRAAMAIRDETRAYARAVRAEYSVDFHIRVGVNTGLVVLATVGDQIRTEYTVMGDTVNVAARLQSNADPDTVLISADTYRLVRHLFDVEPRGGISLKGKSAPVDTYEVVRLKATPGPSRGLEGVTSPLVGRATELNVLRRNLERLRTGEGGFIALLGEAGLGKSRLVAEARDEIAGDSVGWHEGRSLSFGQRSHQPWREILLSLIGAQPSDAPPVARDRLVETMRTLDVAHDRQPFLEALLAIESASSVAAISQLDGKTLAARLADAVRDVVRAAAARAPLALVFEDLHWADSASLDLILDIAPVVKERSLLLICVARTGADAPSSELITRARDVLGQSYREITLKPLAPALAGELMGNLLFIEELPESTRALILKRSDGNPFFLEEIIRALIDAGSIIRENGHWRATAEIIDATIPETLTGVLGARIDRLPEKTRQVVQFASVLGRIFAYRILKRVGETGPPEEQIPDLNPHLERLISEELIRERARQPDLEYIFKHALTQEAAYSLMLLRRRKEYHRRAGLALEQIYAERLDEHAAALAHHFWHADEWEAAADYAMRAGLRVQSTLYALREAHEHFDRAWQALKRLKEPPPDKLIDAVLAWATHALRFVSREVAFERLHEVEAIARAQRDKHRLSQVLHWIGHFHLTSGYTSRALPALFENYELSEELGDERLRVYPAWIMALELLDSNPRSAAQQLRDVAEAARLHRYRDIEAFAWGTLAVAHARLGEFSDAEQSLAKAFDIIEGFDTSVTVADAYLIAAVAHFDMGNHELGMKYARRGTDLALEANALECAGFGFCAMGLSKLQLNEAEDALSTFEESMRFREGYTGDHILLNQVQAGMAIARYASGRNDSLDEMEAALENSHAIGDDYTSALICLALADAYLGLEQLERAELCVSETLDYYRRTEMRPHLLRALDVLARLRERQGDRRATDDARDEAEQLRREIKLPLQTS